MDDKAKTRTANRAQRGLNRTGRPTKDPRQIRKARTLMLSDEEDEQLSDLAERYGMPKSTFVRHLIFSRPLPLEVDQRGLAEALARVGNNLNQLVRHFHSGSPMAVELGDLQALLATIRSRMFGVEASLPEQVQEGILGIQAKVDDLQKTLDAWVHNSRKKSE